MKRKLSAIVVILLITVCAFCVSACDDNNPSGGDNPVYIELTPEEFAERVEEFLDFTNYTGVFGNNGYSVKAHEINNRGIESSYSTIEALIDLRDYTDVKLSAELVIENTGYFSGSGSSGAKAVPVTTKTEINIYLFDHTLYVDKTEMNKTERDSIQDIDNDITKIINLLINTSVDSNISDVDMYSLYIVDILEYLPTLAVDMTEGFKDYLFIDYCEALDHYKIEINYPGGVYDETDIDAFKAVINFHVKNKRIVDFDVDYQSLELSLKTQIAETNGGIDYPADKDKYNGTLLDEFEEFYRYRNMDESIFYGQWEDEFDSYYLEISADSLTLVYKKEEDVKTFSPYISASLYIVAVDDDKTYKIKYFVENDTLIAYMPEGQNVLFTRVSDN